MKRRETLFLIGTATLLVVAGVVLFGSGSDGIEVGPSIDAGPERPAVVADGAEVETPTAVAPVEGPVEDDRRIDPAAPGGGAPTSGVIDGSIRMTTDLATDIERYTIWVREEVNANLADIQPAGYQPFERTYRQDIDTFGTPRFLITGIPFSKCGYRVKVFVPGVNGSSQIVQLTAENPRAVVSLALTPGVPFSVRLHDQHRNPLPDERVVLQPLRGQAGLPRQDGTTDSFGSAVFETVLAGDYTILVGDQEVDQVQVQPTAFTGNLHKIDIQHKTIEVPVGPALRIEVAGPAGYGIPNAKLELQAIDTIENRRMTGETDFAGIYEFKHITPGRYQLDVSAEGFGRWTRQVSVPKDGTPDVVKPRLTN